MLAEILLFLLDDVGYADAKGPTFDALRAGGVEFTRAYAQPWCAPARDSLYRSRWRATGHGKICDGTQDTAYPNLPKLFQGHGLPTTLIGKSHEGGTKLPVPWESAPHLMGWDHWYAGQPVTNPTCGWLGTEWVIEDGVQLYDPTHHTPREEAAAYLASGGLIVVSFRDAHSPWEAPPGAVLPPNPTQRELFEAEVAALDAAMGRIIAAHPGAWVIVLGDNGTPAAVDTDNLRGSKHEVYEGGVRVPLLFYGPGLRQRVVRDPVSIVDLAPTIADALGWDVPDWMQGESLLPVLAGGRVSRPWVFVQHATDKKSAIIERDFKLVMTPNGREFYALPDEWTKLPLNGSDFQRLASYQVP